MTEVERPLTQEKHSVSLAGNVAGCQKQTVAGRTPGPRSAPLVRKVVSA